MAYWVIVFVVCAVIAWGGWLIWGLPWYLALAAHLIGILMVVGLVYFRERAEKSAG